MKYEAIKIVSIFVPHPLVNDYLLWFDERIKMTRSIADTHFCWVIHEDKCKRRQTI